MRGEDRAFDRLGQRQIAVTADEGRSMPAVEGAKTPNRDARGLKVERCRGVPY
jgi:hypothetical protein